MGGSRFSHESNAQSRGFPVGIAVNIPANSKKSEIFWEFMGAVCFCMCSTIYGVWIAAFSLGIVKNGAVCTLYLVFTTPLKQDMPHISRKNLLRPTISQAIPVFKMRTGHKRQQDLVTLPSQVSYRHPLHRMKEIRRVREQTSPQVARAAGLPGNGTGGGLVSGSRSIRRFHSKPRSRARDSE